MGSPRRVEKILGLVLLLAATLGQGCANRRDGGMLERSASPVFQSPLSSHVSDSGRLLSVNALFIEPPIVAQRATSTVSQETLLAIIRSVGEQTLSMKILSAAAPKGDKVQRSAVLKTELLALDALRDHRLPIERKAEA